MIYLMLQKTKLTSHYEGGTACPENRGSKQSNLLYWKLRLLRYRSQ